MSFYNALFGTNSQADLLLAALGITQADAPRFRDCYVDELERLVIYTRTGGGNRAYYESEESCRDRYPERFGGTDDPSGPWNTDLRQLPGYQYDEDDEFDSTYAHFFFDLPAQIKNGVIEIAKHPADKWQEMFAALREDRQAPETEKALEVGKEIFKNILEK